MKMMRVLAALSAVMLGLMHSLPARAMPLAVVGQGKILSGAPLSVDGSYLADSSMMQEGFLERVGVVLPYDLAVDGGFIPAGTIVDSTLISLRNPGDGKIYAGATWTFAGPVIGVMSDRDGAMESASSELLGNPLTIYSDGFANRGFEGGDWYQVGGDGRTLDVGMWVASPGDWIRVVTATVQGVPAPASLALLLLGLAALAWARHRASLLALPRVTTD